MGKRVLSNSSPLPKELGGTGSNGDISSLGLVPNLSAPVGSAAFIISNIANNIGTTRAGISNLYIPSPIVSFRTVGHATPGDNGDGIWKRGTSTGLMAIQDSLGQWWNLSVVSPMRIEMFGAKGDYSPYGGCVVSTTSGNTTINISGAPLSAADVGKTIQIAGAGAGGGYLKSIITAVNSATSITVSPAPGTTMTNQTKVVHLGTDNTSAIQAALSACQGRGTLGYGLADLRAGAGRFAHSGIDINRAIDFSGAGRLATQFISFAGLTRPGINVTGIHDGYNYNAGGEPFCKIALKHFRVQAVDPSDPTTGSINAHGIAFVGVDSTGTAIPNTVFTMFEMDEIDTVLCPGSGLYTLSPNGAICINKIQSHANRKNGYDFNSTFDGKVYAIEAGNNGADGMSLSGCGGWEILSYHIYTSVAVGIRIFNQSGTTNDGSIMFGPGVSDDNGQQNLFYDSRNLSQVHFYGGRFQDGGRIGGNGILDDIWIAATANSNLVLTGCHFTKTYLQGNTAGSARYNIGFASNTQTVLVSPDCFFAQGSWNTPNVVSNPDYIRTSRGPAIPWSDYTATITPGSGTLALATQALRYTIDDRKTISLKLMFKLAASGGVGSNGINIPLPSGIIARYNTRHFGWNNSGSPVVVIVNSGDNKAIVYSQSAYGQPGAAGDEINSEFSFEIQ